MVMSVSLCHTAVVVGLGKGGTGPGEAARGQGLGGLGRGLLLQGLDQDALQAAHVDEVGLQGPAAGGVALGGVRSPRRSSLCPCLTLAQGSGPIEETVGELSHGGTQLGGLGLDAVGSPGGVGGKLGGVVGGVGGAAAPGLAEVGLDQLTPVVDSHQLAVHPDLHPLARGAQGGGHRVQGLLALDMMVLVHLGIAPVGDLVELAVPGEQGLALLVLEDHQGLAAGGAVDASPATWEHQRWACPRTSARPLNSPPLKKRSLA